MLVINYKSGQRMVVDTAEEEMRMSRLSEQRDEDKLRENWSCAPYYDINRKIRDKINLGED
jgi:hypothetical protein